MAEDLIGTVTHYFDKLQARQHGRLPSSRGSQAISCYESKPNASPASGTPQTGLSPNPRPR